MTELIPLLQGKALLIELPEDTRDHQIITGYDKDGPFPSLAYNGRGYEPIRLPEGNWRIIGMLSEVTEEQVTPLLERTKNGLGYLCYNKTPTVHFQGEDCYVSETIYWQESLESAIEAADWYFENPYVDPGLIPSFELERFRQAQSRVLSRERCLLLGGGEI